MDKKICYHKESLLALIPEAKIKLVKTNVGSEDYEYAEERPYLVVRDDVSSMRIYHSLWTSTTVYFTNNSFEDLYANNVNTKDTGLLRVTNNKIISPELHISDSYIGATKELQEWLINYGLTQSQLDEITEEFEVYHTMEYPGVPDVLISHGHFAYSSNNLKLDEREIKTVLDGIEDKLLREKIKVILYARVFKQKY